ncbi:oligopeptide transport system substrate-binding protein [Hasllibacter halocynthiae]|uniref:Oligopeptide transport system substrate-binding protein n=1 Tax=Hasllibacter halocynthiae TaxID=595589 RepID=A0A2T0X2A2_9RHOB|nr:peptide ABC transporter substrate-binding protein [Hasllibacter halocynthiae]PRY93072.1 oligopeptide transport system substrate-binding protein [Hasllibacter halocynthiae]
MIRTATGTLAALLLSTAAFAQDATNPETGEPLAEDQSFTYRMLDDWKSIDPQLVEETAGNHAVRQLFEGLYNSAPDGTIEPGVALSHEVSDDGLTYTFTLRDDARWSDGEPVTAQDFVYGIQRAVDPELASNYSWYIELATVEGATEAIAGEIDPSEIGVRAIDDTTLEITLEEALPYFPQMVTYSTFFPARQDVIEEHGADWVRPGNIVGNGAYVLTDYRVGERWSAEKSDTYWNADDVIIDEVTGLIINDPNQALTRYFDGEVDMTEPLPAGQFPELKEEYPDQAHSIPRLCSYYYAFNQSESGPEALKDPNVRRALSLAVDRSVITDQILQGGQTPAYTFAHQDTANFEMPVLPDAQMTQAERDAEAQRLWEEAGSPDLTLDLIYNTSDQHEQIATIVSQMWKQKLGVDTDLSNYEWSTYLDVRGGQNFDISRSAWCADYNEASSFLDLMTSNNENNDGKYANPRVDELIDASRTAENPQEIYTEVEEILNEDTAIIPIYHYSLAFMLDEDVKGWPFENAENNWYARDLYRVAGE